MILRQLYRLAGIVYKLNRYRFYAASLLFIYDGDAAVQAKYKKSLLHEASASKLENAMNAINPFDEETASEAGLSSPPRATLASSKLAADLASTQSPPSRIFSGQSDSPLKQSIDGVLHPKPSHLSPPNPRHQHSRKHKIPGCVTIRLIDFAHCTTGDDFVPPRVEGEAVEEEEVDDGRIRATFPPTHPNQPDLGFLLGLKSLCAALKGIWETEEEKRRASAGTFDEPVGKLRVPGEEVFEDIFGKGSIDQGLGEGPGPESVWNLGDLVTA